MNMGYDSTPPSHMLEGAEATIERDEAEESRSQYMGSQSSDNDSPTVESSDEQERLLRKIESLGEKIKAAVKAKEVDVDEFLRLSTNLASYSPDSPQVIRVRMMFHKKNKKSTQLINNLQKKLQVYQTRLKELEEGGSLRRGLTETVLSNVGHGLKGVGANIKESLSGYTESVMSVPKDLTKRLLLKSKSGSAENIPYPSTEAQRHFFGMDTSGSQAELHKPLTFNASPEKWDSLRDSVDKEMYDSVPAARTSEATNAGQLREEVNRLRSEHLTVTDELSALRTQVLQEYNFFHGALHEEKCRYQVGHVAGCLSAYRVVLQRLEEQMNDSTELHQAEVLNLKHEVQTLEGRLLYQFRDQLQDLQELIARSQDKMESLEKSVKDLQQAVGLENISNVNASGQALRALLLFLQIVIFLLFALWQVASPCFRTRSRLFTTVVLITTLIYVAKNWDPVHEAVSLWLAGSRAVTNGQADSSVQ